uniref:Peptidase S1 domain-containing protein n=1 Tax=Megaselia scalaris TaxID=36166 RepID=T1H2C1_MEGSC
MFRVLTVSLLSIVFASANDRILGGSELDIHKVPYQASLLYQGQHDCGGVIISDHVILTAAHCIEGSLRFLFKIRVGSHFLNDGVFLKVRLEFNENIRPIDLASALPLSGTNCLVSGWGSTENSINSWKLLGGRVQLMYREECVKFYGIHKISIL